ncbi:alpha/beta hydrolase [Saccharopolyspora phatthalungensis]|uniref:Pimeloyl-ACP methyl ester carboxylesterase n=1 Tax=Saccharopolyspora phatthalungensis TaxID=664693 RepID=A0A840Q6B8_9PSEU|nr:alpha/beta hydrolase [Saccharopolyspora phatthalungensis]MBB5156174.1 pimeloyl-ACP methyl ester carboxylesterase [Saccharopolyspora phatthalungensis]
MNRLLLVLSAVVLLGGAACNAPVHEAQPLQPHTERKGPVGPVPAGLERYYGQTLSWGPCAPYARTDSEQAAYRNTGLECARLEVPMDYAAPQGQTITIGVLRKPATDPGQRIGSLVMNPGGPGASGMGTAASLASTVSQSELGARFDLVGFDPRGVGASEPTVHCLTDQERDAERLDSDADTSPSGVAQTEQEERDHAGKCAERTSTKMLANVGTREVIKDIDVLRSALGDEKLTYLGFSYGTRIGAGYAENFPGNVRAMVLDGAIDPGQSTSDQLVAQGAGFQRAFNDFAAWCAKRQQCSLGHDPSHAVAVFQQITRPLVNRPAPAGTGRELSYKDASMAAIQALYAPSLWDQLDNGLAQLREGDGRSLLSLADNYYSRGSSGRYSNTTDAFDAVHCVDDQRVEDPARVREADRRYREVAPFLDNGSPPSAARDLCAFWPVPVSGEPTQPQVGALPPVLVISTTGDPATPYVSGVKLAQALHGRLLTFEGTQHTAFLQGISCVDDAATNYLVDLTLPAEGARCTSG